jgi:hypothetical protein
MKKPYFQAIVMLMVFSIFCNATLFAKITQPKNNTLFTRTTHVVFGNTSGGTKMEGTVLKNSYWQTQRAKGYVDFTHCSLFPLKNSNN